MAGLLNPGAWVKDALAGAANAMGDYIIEPVISIILFTPVPLRNGDLALIRRPTNGPWPQIYDFAHEGVLPSVFALLFLGYLISYLMRALPRFSYQQQEIQGNIISAMILTYWSWPLGVGILAFFDGLTKAVAPPPSNLSDLFVAQILAMVGVVAAPGPNILAGIVGFLDVLALIGVLLLYLFRIFYIMIFMQLIFLIVAVYLADIPYLKGISSKAFSVFVKLSYIPIFMAATLALSDILFASATNVNLGLSLATDFIYGVMSLILPVAGIFIYILVLSSSTPGGTAVAATAGVASAAAGVKGKSVGSVGEPENDDYDGKIEEKAANVEENLPEYTQQGAEFAGSAAMSAGSQTKQTASKIASARSKSTPTMNSSMQDIAKGTTQSIGYNETPDEPLTDDEPTPAELMQQQFDGRPDPGSVDPGAQEPVAVSEEAFGELDEDMFERAVEGSEMSRSGMQTYLNNLEETHGREAVEEFVNQAAMSQGVAESGHRLHTSVPNPAEAAVPDEPAEDASSAAADADVPDLTAAQSGTAEMIETTDQPPAASASSGLVLNPDGFTEGSVGEGQWEETPEINKQQAAEVADTVAEEWDGEGDPDEEFLRMAARAEVPGVSEAGTKEGQPAEYAVVDQYNKRHEPTEPRRTDTDSFEYVESDDQSSTESPEATETTNSAGSSGGRDPVDILESDD